MAEFEDAVNRQNELGKTIEQFIINVGKDPISRRTLDYYTKKLAKLTELSNEFLENDKIISEFESTKTAHKYFTSNYYRLVQDGVEMLMEKMKNNVKKLEKSVESEHDPTETLQPEKVRQNIPSQPTKKFQDKPQTKDSNTSNEDQKELNAASSDFSFNPYQHQEANTERAQCLISRQDSIIRVLKHLIWQINLKSSEQHSIQYYELKIQTINSYWSTIADLNPQIWELIELDSESAGHRMEVYFSMEEMVQEAVLHLSESLAHLIGTSTNRGPYVQQNHQSQVKLPKITIPIFDGDYLKWQQFFDTYTQMIHNTTISSSDKMFYLNSNLSGEAKTLVKHLPISNENYLIAWRILTHRYNNKRILITALLNKLLSQPSSQHESASAIRSLHDITTECTLGLESLGIAVESWDAILLHILSKKLDRTTHNLYEQSLQNPAEPQKLVSFLEFLETRFQSLDALGYKGRQQADRNKGNSYQKLNNSKSSFAVASSSVDCKVCHQNHLLYQCPTFIQMTPEQRLKKLKEVRLCINCLKDGHFSPDCASRHCKSCDKKHNTLVHGAFEKVHVNRGKASTGTQRASSTQLKTGPPHQPSNDKATVSFGIQQNCHTFLATAVIQAVDVYGESIECRALLDSGSQVNLITKQLSKRLGLRVTDSDLRLTGIGGAQQAIQRRITLNIKSNTSSYSRMIEAFVMNQIIDDQPNYNINPRTFDIPHNIKLADPKFFESQKIDMLIGAELYSELMMVGQIVKNKNTPTLQNTVFGWVVLGKVQTVRADSQFCGISTLDEQLERFWELDDLPTEKAAMSAVEQKCENFFNNTTYRNNLGQFVVRLPFKEDVNLLGSSREIAERRFLAIERKLTKNGQLRQEYVKFMKEYEALGHMEVVENFISNESHYFIPHHCVLKPTSTTTKLRVVFDASCKTSTNVSLNQLLHTGPKIQQDLFDVLIRFRQHRYVFTGDIEKMYRQIKMVDQDMNFQLIFWRDHPKKKLNVYKLKTVTYGTTSAPYIAIKCLQSLGEACSEYPLAEKMVKTDFYVDDLMSGSDNLSHAIDMQSQVSKLLNSAGFKLRKWCANHKTLLKNIPVEDIERSLDITDSNSIEIKTLGITWDPRSDIIAIKTCWKEQSKITKRMVLADVAHIFDPIGLVSPVVIIAKIFLQELWKQKLDWDAALPMNLHTKWALFRHSLKHLDSINIPRHVRSGPAGSEIQLHAFSDASERAFGAAVYVRSINVNNEIIVRLLCSKSRVAPSKISTLPRLELQAAKLAAELCTRVRTALQFDDANMYYWTDSEIVLHWLNAESSSFKTFVANRISYIQRHTTQSHWRHVSSAENPADHISRGISPERLQHVNIWFNGPQFLQQPTSEWPREFQSCGKIIEETRAVKSVLVTSRVLNHFIFHINHKNSFSFLVRTTAYVTRFAKVLRDNTQSTSFLLMSEIHDAFVLVIKSLQELSFGEEIRCLQRKGELDNKNRLSSLTPFVDAKGVLRVGGRIEAAHVSYDSKHPILLPADHVFTQLIMTEIHVQNHHIGPQTLIAFTRQRFWPIHGKRMANKIVHKCMQCFRAKPTPMSQLMGNLPAARVQPGRPFITAGVDFAGPIWTHFKIRGKRPQKSYIALFCCFATRAIHLEIVSDLSADGFIGALRRFWSRRGRCKTIYSDNATNFIGGRNHLQELYEMFNQRESTKKIHSECLARSIDFHFIPPRAPHFGGLWESAVKSTKNLLYKTMGAASLTYEELCTLTAEIEAILNSRPLTPMSDDVNDMTALTPAHFLIGEPLTTIVDTVAEIKNIDNLSRWKLVSYIKEEFWRRWQCEYISNLQQRYKWKTKCQNARPGLMVLIKEDNQPPTQWRLGRIKKTYKGNDGLIRVVDVKTASGHFKRPIHKLCPLPIDDNQLPTQDSKHINEEEELINEGTQMTQNPNSYSRSTIKQKSVNIGMAALLTLLILPICIKAQTQSAIEINKFDSFPGIYFESAGMTNLINNEWQLVVYYDLQNYGEELKGFENGIKKLRTLCEKLTNGTYCKNILSLFEHNLADINVYNEVILNADTTSTRTKRGAFDIIGNVASKLFGVLDSDYADKMAKIIKTIDRNEQSMSSMLENHTLIIEATANVIKKTQQQVNQQFEIFDRHLDEIEQKMNDIDSYFEQQGIQHMFSSLSVQTMLVMSNYQKVQLSLLDVLTDSHHGKINPLLLTPTQLKNALFTIKDNLSPDLKLPFFGSHQTDLNNIYNLLHVQGRLSMGHFIFKIQIPLASNHQFETFRLIPIPVRVSQNYITIKPSSSYLIVSLHRDLFYPMSGAEAASCVKVGLGNLLCKQAHPLYNSNSEYGRCEIALLNHQPVQPSCELVKSKEAAEWIQLLNPNHWIFSLSQKTTIRIVCNDESSAETLVGMGIVKIKKNCVIKQDTLTITSHNVHPTQLRSSFSPTADLNSFINETSVKTNNPHTKHDVPKIHLDDITKIQQQIQDIKSKQTTPEQLDAYDLHHFTIGYAGLIIAILVAVGFIWSIVKYRTRLFRKKGPVPTPRKYTVNADSDFTFNIENQTAV